MNRLLLCVCVFVLLLLSGHVDTGFTAYTSDLMQKSYQNLYDGLNVEFKDEQQKEYGKGIWNTRDLLQGFQGGTMYITQEKVELSQVGQYDVRYILKAEDEFGQTITKSYVKTINVKDTKKPVITFKKSSIELTTGDSFDPASNVSSVKDPVDGSLSKASALSEGTYVISSNVNTNAAGNYTVTVRAEDINGNVSESSYSVKVKVSTYNHTWDGTVLNPVIGTVYGPSGRETYYNLPMQGVINIMRRMGNNDPYWIREDGVKMLGNYVMVAADLHIRPRGSLIETSLGMGIVCDTGAFALRDPYQLDIAVNW